MKVEKQMVVTVHYEVSDRDGGLLESTLNSNPLTLLFGQSTVLPALEKGLEGLAEGEKFEFSVPPFQGFGLTLSGKNQKIPRQFFQEKDIAVGARYKIETPKAVKVVTVDEVTQAAIGVDANHPLAGKTLVFKGHIEKIRKATAYELTTGKVSGK